MAPSLATTSGVSLLLLSILLPLRFLDLSLRFFFARRSNSGLRAAPTRSLIVFLSATVLVVSIYAFSDPITSPGKGAEAVAEVEEVRREMAMEIQALKDRNFQLESNLVESTKKLDDKAELLEENSKVIEAMERDIQYLINEQEEIKIRHKMEIEIQALKDHVVHLESSLLESTKNLDAKTELLEENSKVIAAMEHDIQYLINEHQSIKSSLSTSYSQDDTKDLEQEVELLKDQSRSINSNIYHLELSAKDTERKLESLNSEIVKIQSIISEQWIQIRHLEQAFQQTKIMASRVQRRTRQNVSVGKRAYQKVLQFVEVIRFQLIQDITMLESFVMGPLGTYLSDAFDILERFSKIAQKQFHELLQLIRRIRLRHVSDVDVLDSFFMGCSVTRPCLPHVYNHFNAIKLVAHKCLHLVMDVLNRMIDSI